MKFCVANEISCSETFKMLQKASGDLLFKNQNAQVLQKTKGGRTVCHIGLVGKKDVIVKWNIKSYYSNYNKMNDNSLLWKKS